ncbi:hypothetical protein OH76DRAFT_856336 [Lentinus brumalis]|uniref:Uncharacterized protein n=1 Tax=Lentinus brumalis TaxID=2498619 RepID=A0A371DR37_9APHY|nr:hypothetical protein OH76DRAFT_856336 [Polyporus brumalis]
MSWFAGPTAKNYTTSKMYPCFNLRQPRKVCRKTGRPNTILLVLWHASLYAAAELWGLPRCRCRLSCSLRLSAVHGALPTSDCLCVSPHGLVFVLTPAHCFLPSFHLYFPRTFVAVIHQC